MATANPADKHQHLRKSSSSPRCAPTPGKTENLPKCSSSPRCARTPRINRAPAAPGLYLYVYLLSSPGILQRSCGDFVAPHEVARLVVELERDTPVVAGTGDTDQAELALGENGAGHDVGIVALDGARLERARRERAGGQLVERIRARPLDLQELAPVPIAAHEHDAFDALRPQPLRERLLLARIAAPALDAVGGGAIPQLAAIHHELERCARIDERVAQPRELRGAEHGLVRSVQHAIRGAVP